MDIRAILAANLRSLRREKGLSQEELAHRADIDRTYISSLERSVYAAGIDVVDRLALGVEPADLLRAPDAPNNGRAYGAAQQRHRTALAANPGSGLCARAGAGAAGRPATCRTWQES